MSWWALVGLGAASYVLKAVGLLGLGPRAAEGRLLGLAALLPAALLPALVAVQTFGGDRRLVLDARAAGLAVAVAATMRKLPFAVVVVLAATTTAAVRAASA